MPLLTKLRDPQWIKREFWQMFRYGIVGLVSTGIFFGGYALLSRVLWKSGNPTVIDAIVITISAVFNFTLHRAWSFKANGFNFAMVRRYVTTIVAASALQVALFHFGTAILHVLDFYVQIFLVPFMAFLQYIGHRMFTFHRKYESVSRSVGGTAVATARAGESVSSEAN